MAKNGTGPLALIKTKEGKFFRHIDVMGFNGYVPCECPYPEAEPTMSWYGGKIPLTLWSQVMAFFEWSQQEFKSEAQVRLYYHPDSKKWGVWAYPQTPDGMATKEIENHPDVAQQRAQFPSPWILLGTIHHHCTSLAFQSGTDKHNEETQEGVHITVGKIGSAEYDLHTRLVVKGYQYDRVPLIGWFDLPPNTPEEYPYALRQTILEFFLKRPIKDVDFPEQWKKNCIKKSIQISGGSSYHTSAGAASASSSGSHLRNTVPVKTDLRAQFKQSEIDFMREAIVLLDLRQLSQNQVDAIMFEMKPEARKEDEVRVTREFVAIAAKNNIPEKRLDQLFDCWSFDAVIGKLFPTTTAISV